METVDIVQEEGISSAYEQHSGKFQPKPRLLDTVIEEEEEEAGSHYSLDDTNQSQCMVNECTNTAFYQEEEEEHNIPQVHKESASNVLEQDASPSNNDTVMGQEETQSNEAQTRTDKKKRGRKKKATTNEEEEEEANKSPEKKKFKHSIRRQKNTTLDKELLETPDDKIKHLHIRDMLRLVAFRESLEKKEAKGAPVVPPTQESNTNTCWDNQYYYSQGFDAQGEFGMEEGEEEDDVAVKPDSPVNYQTYMKKTPRSRWSKEETQVFYEGIQAFGINLSMVQELLEIQVGKRTLHQVKLKYKLEERKNPLKLNDALSTPFKDLTRYHTVIKEEAASAKEGEEAETTIDVPENNEEQTKSDEQAGDGVAGVKESDGGDQFDENEGDDDDDDFWNSYKSEM
ncbi:unnamed protein product [Eruca vesicaria subsp. sativa]|uniref:Myb-like domain-containing protein n=1 Tax=Eruca vesicaria subsp. sativa TaxID=29727 RepID=A0ABC8KZ04_ERUVS|nr:unnamed protein product [Eruca vesicaria subsp. sativa]